MYNRGKTRKPVPRRRQRAAAGEVRTPARKGLPHLAGCAWAPLLYLLTHTGWFLDEAFMYSNC